MAKTKKPPESSKKTQALQLLVTTIDNADEDGDNNLDRDELTRALRSIPQNGDEEDAFFTQKTTEEEHADVAKQATGYMAGTALHADFSQSIELNEEDTEEQEKPEAEKSPSRQSGAQTARVHHETAESKVKRLMKEYDKNSDGVLDDREMLDMFKDIAKKLNEERQDLGQKRMYHQAAEARDTVIGLHKRIQETQERMERERGDGCKANFDRARDIMSKNNEEHIKELKATSDESIERKSRIFDQKLSREKEELEISLRAQPLPKPRFSKKLIAMRHAEMALARGCRFEEAYDLRRSTKKAEEEEFAALTRKFYETQDLTRNTLTETHEFERQRHQETTKDLQWRAKRYFAHEKSLFSDRMRFHKTDIDHALTMDLNKVKGTQMNADMPSRRKVNIATNSGCRGQRQLEQVIGKRHLAIPGLCEKHDFGNIVDFPIISEVRQPKNRFKNSSARGSMTAR